MSNNMVKKIIHNVNDPLTFLNIRSLKEGNFSIALKLSKKYCRVCLSIHRPISITPVFSKIFESLIYSQICCYLELYSIFGDKQY